MSEPLINSQIPPLIPVFDSLRVTTMTVVIPMLGITALNLLAIFTLLPYVEVDLCVPLPKGKFKYPKEWNKKHDIVSIRYGNLTRGYQRKRKQVRAFPYNISIDIGTSKRIVNVKFSQTIKVTGAPDLITAKEATEGILKHLSRVNQLLTAYKQSLPLSIDTIIDSLLPVQTTVDQLTFDTSTNTSIMHEISNDISNETVNSDNSNTHDIIVDVNFSQHMVDNHDCYMDVNHDHNGDNTINIVSKHVNGNISNSNNNIVDEQQMNMVQKHYDELMLLYHDKERETIEFFIKNFAGDTNSGTILLYEGELECGKYEVEMINMNFDIGLMINRRKMAEIFNNAPFACYYNNILPCPKLLIYHFYPKKDKMGKPKVGKHTFKVCETGNITYSGPHPDHMRIIYNTFMTRVLVNYDDITTRLQKNRQIDVTKGRTMSQESWFALRQSELQYTSDLAEQKLPVYEEELFGTKYTIAGDDIPNLKSVLNSKNALSHSHNHNTHIGNDINIDHNMDYNIDNNVDMDDDDEYGDDSQGSDCD